MLVPVGCGMELDESVMLSGEEYEHTLNWIYERSQQSQIQLKATCVPHYFRVIRQRAKAEGKPMPHAHHPHGHSAAENQAQPHHTHDTATVGVTPPWLAAPLTRAVAG